MTRIETSVKGNRFPKLLWEGLKLLGQSAIPLPVWVALFITSAGILALPVFPTMRVMTQNLATALGGMSVLALWYFQYRSARYLAAASADEKGSMLAWFGWGVTCFLPAIIAIILTPIIFYPSQDYGFAIGHFPPWGFTALCASSLLLLNPVYVHATGVAIDAEQRSVSDCWSDMLSSGYWHTGLAIALAFAVPASIADILGSAEARYIIKSAPNETVGRLYYSAVLGLSGIFQLFGYLWSTAIAANRWRHLEAEL